MAERIILTLVCLLCAVPFFLLAWVGQMGKSPMHFRNSDDAMLARTVKDVPAYNRAMAKAFRLYAAVFLTAAAAAAFFPALGLILLGGNATAGLWLLWKAHRKILKQYS